MQRITQSQQILHQRSNLCVLYENFRKTNRMLRTILTTCVLFSICMSCNSQSCANYHFVSNQVFSHCNDLPYLNSYLHWNYDQSAKTVKIAYRHSGISPSRWVAWAINPTSQGMAGSQAIVAFQRSDGSMRAYTTPINSYQTQLQEGNLSFPVSDLTATYSRNEITIFSTLKIDIQNSSLNQVWQEGPVSGDSPGMHSTTGSNVQAMGTLNFLSGKTRAAGGGLNSRTKKRNIHGLLNAVSWGIMLPIGAIIARYLKVFPAADPAWFYLHLTCQIMGYFIGVAGWATGIRLGSQSPGVEYTAHRIIGIILFTLGTLQATAMLLRPKRDHKHRFYWNIYHHVIGYSIIVLSIINIFKGFDILNPDEKWKRLYTGILIGLAFAVAILEIFTWCVVLTRKRASQNAHISDNGSHKRQNGANSEEGYNAYAARTQYRV